MSDLRPGTCGEGGPYGDHCSQAPGHQYACYDAGSDRSFVFGDTGDPAEWFAHWRHCHDGACPDSKRPIPTGYVYVASSWRNERQPAVVAALQDAGWACYDFKNPDDAPGFHWSEVGLQRENDVCSPAEYLAAMDHDRSIDGFGRDWAAMRRADAFVLVLPCGRSAHLELGWAVGAGVPTAIILDDPVTPELMYRMVDHIGTDVVDTISWLNRPLDERDGSSHFAGWVPRRG